jgi:ribosomal protein S18 acetylase RimI-like enzyme
MAIPIRPATVSDIPHLASFLLEATGGIIEAIYHGVIPERPTHQIVEHLFSRSGTVSSLANCWVAEQGSAVVGGLNAFPYDAFDQEPANPLFLEERRPLARIVGQLRAPGSYYIRAIAVYPASRGAGVGRALLAHAHREGAAHGCLETSLHVFAENTRAVALYTRLGYTEVARRPAPTHALIRYGGDILLMRRRG